MGAPIRTPRVPVVSMHGGVPMADSRDVARFFGKEHKNLLRSIRTAKCSEDFRGRNFEPFVSKGLAGEDVTEYVLMTKNGFAFVCLAFTGEKAAAFREDYINAFDRMEQALRNPPSADPLLALQDPRQLLQLLGTYAERTLALEAEVEAKGRALVVRDAVIAEQRPKVDALDEIAGTEGTWCITDAAKELGIKPKHLFRYMRDKDAKMRWLYQRSPSSPEVAFQDRLDDETLVHKVDKVPLPDGTKKSVTQVRVTALGLTRLAVIFAPRLPGIG